MIVPLYIAAAVIMAVGSLYFAWRNRDVRKFLAGAFLVSSGILFYLYLAGVSVPLLGTRFVETPEIGSISFKVSEKAAVSVYGLGRFPVTLYLEQWETLLAHIGELREFIEANKSRLKTKG